MPLSPPTALLLTLCLATALLLFFMAAIWRRLGALPLAEFVRQTRELADRQRDLEALLTRIEQQQVSPETAKGPPIFSPSRSRRRFDPASPSAVAGPTLIAVPNLASPHADASAAASAELGRRFGAIWELADSGTSAERIARAIGQPIGQVELILGLRRQITAASPGDSA